MQTLSAVPVIFLLLLPSIHAWPIASPKSISPSQSNQPNETPNSPSTSWSKEAIFALLGVGAAFICCAIGLAWPRLRARMSIHALNHNKLCANLHVDRTCLPLPQHVPSRVHRFPPWNRCDQDNVREEQQRAYTALLEIRRGGY